jgi:hypothetical protein
MEMLMLGGFIKPKPYLTLSSPVEEYQSLMRVSCHKVPWKIGFSELFANNQLNYSPKVLTLLKIEHLLFRLKQSNQRLIFIGEKESLEYDEVEALAKMIGNQKIYYTNDPRELAGLNIPQSDLNMPTFLKLDTRTGTYKRYVGQIFRAELLKRFLITSSLNFPEVFSSQLLGELIGQGIPILAILQTDFNDSRIIEDLSPVGI